MDKIIRDPLIGDIKFPKFKLPKELKPIKPTKQPSKATTQKPKK